MTVDDAFGASCIPQATTTYAIFPYRTDLCTGACGTDAGTNLGIFTSTSGTAPNRIFNIEWRTAYYNSGQTTNIPLNFEVRLYEGLTEFDVIYGTVNTLGTANDGPLSVGVQKDTGQFTLVGCDPTGGQAPPVSSGQLYHYTLGAGCPSPTPAPTPTPTATPQRQPRQQPHRQRHATPTPDSDPNANACTPNPGKIFGENFDSVIVPALPAGWVAANVTGPAPLWVTSMRLPPRLPVRCPMTAFVDDPAVLSDKDLDTPGIAITSPLAQVSFHNNYALEPIAGGTYFFDGGVLEVSSPNINAGAFTDITDAAVGGQFCHGRLQRHDQHRLLQPDCGPDGVESKFRWFHQHGGEPRTERCRANDQVALPHGLGQQRRGQWLAR